MAVVVAGAMASFGLAAVAVPAPSGAQPGPVWRAGPVIASARTLPSAAPQSTALTTTHFPWLKASAMGATSTPVTSSTNTAGARTANLAPLAQAAAPGGTGTGTVPDYLSPAWDGVVRTTTPTFSVQVASGQAVPPGMYIYVTNNPTAPTWSYTVAQEATSQPSLSGTMPAGVLQDGGLYYWDCNGGPWYQFHVNLHVQDAADPTDQLGGLSVDLATGSLGYSTETPTFTTPGGPVGFGFTYNSRAVGNLGLSAEVWEANSIYGYAAQPGTYDDLAYSTTGPGVVYPEYLTEFPNNGEWTIVTYTGLVALPAGAWTLQLTSNQGEECYNQGTVCNFPSSTLWLGTSSSPLGQAGSAPANSRRWTWPIPRAASRSTSSSTSSPPGRRRCPCFRPSPPTARWRGCPPRGSPPPARCCPTAGRSPPTACWTWATTT